MRWPTAMLLAALGTAGCRSQPSDPFLPRTRIPAPPTGAATGAPDAFYTSPTPPMTGAAPPYTPPATGAGGTYAPPGGFPYQQQSPTPAPGSGSYVPGPVSTMSTSTAPPAGNVALAQYRAADSTSATRQPAQPKWRGYVPTADNQPSAVYERGTKSGASSTTLAADDSSSGAIDIMDLPPVQN